MQLDFDLTELSRWPLTNDHPDPAGAQRWRQQRSAAPTRTMPKFTIGIVDDHGSEVELAFFAGRSEGYAETTAFLDRHGVVAVSVAGSPVVDCMSRSL